MSKEILNILEEAMDLPIDTVGTQDNLSQIGAWDSLSVVVFISLVEERLGKKLTIEQFAKIDNVQDLINLVNSN